MLVDSKHKKMLNLGCGDRYNVDWINVDFASNNENVYIHDLKKTLPYPDDTFDVVYHSHALEHFTKSEAEEFIKECYRVLKNGGTIRVAIPDLEMIAKNYMTFLESAMSGDKMSEANYDFTMLEMYDQSVRNESGGEMGRYFKQENIINKDFVRSRIGYFFDVITQKKTRRDQTNWKTYVRKIVPETFIQTFKKIKNRLRQEDYARLGKFRTSGEIHLWMYDRFSLKRLLQNTGFKEAIQRSATESYIENWPGYNLDSEQNGIIYKPDSLFMEAKK